MRLFSKLAETWRFLRYGPTRLTALRTELQQARDAIAKLEAHAASMPAALATVTFQWRQEAGWLRDRLGALDDAAARAPSAAATAPAASEAAQQAFYLALERRFRGTREELHQRLGVYEAWVRSLPEGTVADLGCGRGEWMELVRQWGWPAVGVDLNRLFVEQVVAGGGEATCADVLSWLRDQPSGAYAAVTSFHLVEHLPFPVLLQLVEQARRVLQPGGRLILETPNPENLGVAMQSFWLDPTHVRPLPPPLLQLLVEHAGLELESTLRLNPHEAGAGMAADPALRDLLMQGRDYAVIARKPAGANA
jgi:SAM-dependent methyltransferase